MARYNAGESEQRWQAAWAVRNVFAAGRDPTLPKSWEPDEKLVNDFHDFALSKNLKFTELEFTENHQWVKEQLKQEFYITAFSQNDSDKVRMEQDPEVSKAIEAMPKAQGLLDKAKKMLVQRMPSGDRHEQAHRAQ